MSTKSNKSTGSSSKKKKSVKPSGSSLPTASMAPVSVSSKQSFGNASKKRKSWRFSNSELVQTIAGSVSLGVNKFEVNPGIAATFPWLAVEAAKWEQYRFHSLRFRYVTRSSTAVSGSIILSPDYNPRDNAPTTEKEATDTMDAVEDSIWKELVCVLDPQAMFPFGPRKLIRAAKVAGDINQYDAANMYVCTTGEADTTDIGKLWVDYDVELFVQQNSPTDYSKPSTISLYNIVSDQTYTTGVSAALIWDSTPVFEKSGFGNPSSGVFTPAAGCFLVEGQICVSNTAAESTALYVNVLQNGASLSPVMASRQTLTTPASGILAVPFRAIVSCSGTDTVSVNVNVTGATGTLKALGTECHMTATVV